MPSDRFQTPRCLRFELVRSASIQRGWSWMGDPLDEAAREGATEPLRGPILHPRHGVDEEIAQDLRNGDRVVDDEVHVLRRHVDSTDRERGASNEPPVKPGGTDRPDELVQPLLPGWSPETGALL